MKTLSRLLRDATLVTAAFWGVVGTAAWAGDGKTAIVGILEGSGVLVRQTTRHVLAEGVVLRAEDIVETAPGGFVQIEFDNDLIVSLGESTRAMLVPRLQRPAPKGEPAVQIYLLEGWLKLTPSKSDATVSLLTPRVEILARDAALVVLSRPDEYRVFTEVGTARVVERDGGRATLALKAGEFGGRGAGEDKAATRQNVAPDFVKRMPKFFLDRLPPRAAVVSKRPSVAKPIDAIAYADVAPWLRSEPAVRVPLSRQWRSRASDKRFRSELQANIAAHMEWEPIVFPERFVKKAEASASAASAAAAASAARADDK